MKPADFEIGMRVRRSPKYWKENRIYTVRGFTTSFDGHPLIRIEKLGVKGTGFGYQAKELVRA